MEKPNVSLRSLIDQLSSILDQVAGELEQIGISDDRYNIIKQKLLAGEHELKTIDQQMNKEVTKCKRIEEALDASHEELKDFIYMTSHDFREPLRKISSFGAILKESLDGKIEKEDQENLDFMIDGAERMSQMIDNLLAYSRINTKTLTAEMVDLNAIVEQLKHLDLGRLLEETGAHIEITQPLPKIPADPVLIRQLLRNLIIHTIKHHKEDAQIRIVICAERTAQAEIKIELQNNGVNIQTENAKDLFKMSLRSQSQQNDEEAGTGLAVCKKIVDRHGGRIGLTSNADTSSTLWFILPVSKHLEKEQSKTLS